MKIAFWSEQPEAGTTFNLAVTACAAVLMHPLSIAVVSGGYHDEMLEKKFFGKTDCFSWEAERQQDLEMESILAAESEEYFAARGLDCLLRKERREELTELAVKANMRQVIRDKMYCLPSSVKPEQEWWHQDRLFLRMGRVMDAVESYFDLVFIDCGSRQDDYAQAVIQKADVCVLNMRQDQEHIGDFYQNPPRYRGETFFLLGRYFEDALYNRENLQRLYRMEENRLGAIPYNLRLQTAGQMGKIKNGVKNCMGGGVECRQAEFARELVRTTNLILKLAGMIA